MHEETRLYPVNSVHLHFQNGVTTCRHLSKRLPDMSTGFAAEAKAISLALNYYQHIGPVHQDVVVSSDSMSSFQAIEGEYTKNPFICHTMNLLLSLSDKCTHIRFWRRPSHCGIERNERVHQLATETIDQDLDQLASVHYRFEATHQLLHSAVGSNQMVQLYMAEISTSWYQHCSNQRNSST